MTTEYLLFLSIGAIAGGFINGLAGFGTSLFALGWWLQVLQPIEAVACVLCMTLLSGLQGMFMVRKAINWPVLLRFLIPALVGIPIGLQLLAIIHPTALTLTIAVFLILYGGFFTLKENLPNLQGEQPVLDCSVGFLGGILGAIAGLSGALPTMLCSMRPWPKLQQRALLQPFNFTISGLSAIALGFQGAYSTKTLTSIAIVSPITILASVVGMWVYSKASDTQFRRLLIFLMLLSGLILLARVWLSE